MQYFKVLSRMSALAIGALALGLVVAAIGVAVVGDSGLALVSDEPTLFELFARIALAVGIGLWAVALLWLGKVPRTTSWGLKPQLFFAVYGAGVIASLLDPSNAVRAELNVIRYPTALVLTIAGALFLFSALSERRPLILRLAIGALGTLLILAATDEIFQLHEELRTGDAGSVNGAIPIDGQDLATLVVAVAGISVAFAVRHFLRTAVNRGFKPVEDRIISAADYFLAAGLVFLLAMLLDTFDVVLTDAAAWCLATVLPPDHMIFGEGRLDGYTEYFANSLEEFLEYGAAILLLATAYITSLGKPAPAAVTPPSSSAP